SRPGPKRWVVGATGSVFGTRALSEADGTGCGQPVAPRDRPVWGWSSTTNGERSVRFGRGWPGQSPRAPVGHTSGHGLTFRATRTLPRPPGPIPKVERPSGVRNRAGTPEGVI